MKASKFLRLKALWENKKEAPLAIVEQPKEEVKEEIKQEIKEEVKEEIPVIKQSTSRLSKKKIDEQLTE